MSDRTCARCGISATRVDFKRNKRNPDGLGSYCLPCHRLQSAKYYKDNREAVLDRHKIYRAKNIDQVREHDRTRYQNSERRADSLKSGRRWAEKNPEAMRDSGFNSVTKRRMINLGSDAEWQYLSRREIWESSDGLCGICGDLVPLSIMHVDHIVGLRDGGSHTMDNVQAAHQKCNLAKG